MRTEHQSYYECHITCIGDREKLKSDIESLRWKFSCIDGDIDLGDGIKCYATHQYNKKLDKEAIVRMMTSTALTLEVRGNKIIRQKVELILYDKRF